MFYVPRTVPIIDADEARNLVSDASLRSNDSFLTQDDLYKMVEDMEPAPLHDRLSMFDPEEQVQI